MLLNVVEHNNELVHLLLEYRKINETHKYVFLANADSATKANVQ